MVPAKLFDFLFFQRFTDFEKAGCSHTSGEASSAPIPNARWFALLLLALVSFVSPNKLYANQIAQPRTAPTAYEHVLIVVSEQADLSDVELRFGHEKGSMESRHLYVMNQLKEAAARTQPPIIARLDELRSKGEVANYQTFFVANCIAAEALPDAIREIKAWPGVSEIETDFHIERFNDPPERQHNPLDDPGTEPGLRNIRAPEVWDLGITGAGVLVATLDDGVNGNHPALLGHWRGSYGFPHSACWLDLVGNTTVPTDNAGHGSQTMGIMVGMVPGDTIGVAWGARYISARLNFAGGIALISTALTAFQWLIDPDGNPNTFDDVPRVVSNSWGLEAAAYPICYTIFDTALDNCEAAGIATFFAAGNEGNFGSETIRVPAVRAVTATRSFAVGAYDRVVDSILAESSRGPSPCTEDPLLQIKPEVVAPGRSVRSAWLDSSYHTSSGTSYSSPHAAGTGALMLEVNPELTPDSLKKILLLTAVDKGPQGEDNTYGTGQIDALTAVFGALGGVGWVSGHITDPFGYAIEADVAFQDHPHHVTGDAAGNFVIAMPAQFPLLIQISAATFLPYSNSIILSPGDTLNLSVILNLEPTSGILTGTVINCLGGAADSARVWLPGSGVPDVYTNSQGWFRIVLPAGLYDVSASDDYCAVGTAEDVQIIGQGITDIEIVLPSNPNYLCSNPDAFGYRICDNNDPGGPEYNWNEISPTFGGHGIIYNLADDASLPQALPFTVVFYGESFNRVQINANGDLSFRRSFADHHNWPLPRLVCPIIYPFWDDLNDSWGGDICGDYDPAMGTYTVEWSNVPRYDGLGNETFQVVLFDTAVCHTTSGNSVVEVRYNHVAVDYSCTVGLESGDSDGFIQYVYNGNYAIHASPLQDGRALRMIAGEEIGTAPQFSINNPTVVLEVPQGQTLDTAIVLHNEGDAPAPYAITPPGQTSLSSFDWATSRQSGGPAYSFMDISGIGENTGISRDDTTSDPHLLPWFFPFCGKYFDRLAICSNGYVSFTSCMYSQSYFHYPLGDDQDPFYAIAPYWADLDPSRGGAIYTFYDQSQDRFIIQWNQIKRYSENGPNTFEAILCHDGSIEFAYANMSPPLQYCTVGLKGGGPSEHLQLCYNQTFLYDDMLVRFSREDNSPARIILSQAEYGVVQPLGELRIPVRVQNNEITIGQISLSIDVRSGSAGRSTYPVEVIINNLPNPDSLHVVITPQPSAMLLQWNSLDAQSYCVYSGPRLDEVSTFVLSTPDTFALVPMDSDSVKFYHVRMCDGPPSAVSHTHSAKVRRADDRQPEN